MVKREASAAEKGHERIRYAAERWLAGDRIEHERWYVSATLRRLK
jgi:hypothetical protein